MNDLPGDNDDDRWPEGEIFMEHMADSAKATTFLLQKGTISSHNSVISIGGMKAEMLDLPDVDDGDYPAGNTLDACEVSTPFGSS